MKCNPQTVIDVAESQIGYHEKATNSQLDDFTANSGNNNWNKYARDIDEKYPDFYNGKKNGYDWCDIFVDWCFVTAYGREDAQRLLCQPNHSLGAGCEYSYQYYKDKGQTGSAPKKGAQIFFGDLDHTGIVVDFDSNYVWTVEGNSGNEVKKKKYSRNDSWIYGYGYPKLPSRGYYLTGDGYETNTGMQSDIKLIQQFLKWALGLGSTFQVDGFYGNDTTKAVEIFQKLYNLKYRASIDEDGSYGNQTLKAAKVYTKD